MRPKSLKEQAQAWLKKAASDLRMAELALSAQPPIIDGGAYHCQQLAEKSIKAALVYHDVKFGRTHDLGALSQKLLPFYPNLEEALKRCVKLTDYAIVARYPDAGDEELTDADFHEAFQDAKELYTLITQVLP